MDGRGCEDYRHMEIETDVVSNTDGSSKVTLVTEVFCMLDSVPFEMKTRFKTSSVCTSSSTITSLPHSVQTVVQYGRVPTCCFILSIVSFYGDYIFKTHHWDYLIISVFKSDSTPCALVKRLAAKQQQHTVESSVKL